VIVVFDTNVLISALQFSTRRSTPTLALEKAMVGDVIATCEPMEAELLRVLIEKFRWEADRAVAAMHMILARSLRVRIHGTVKVCRDPNDDMFLECAASAKADLLVAGDKDLLALGAYKVTRIITPAVYLNLC